MILCFVVYDCKFLIVISRPIHHKQILTVKVVRQVGTSSAFDVLSPASGPVQNPAGGLFHGEEF